MSNTKITIQSNKSDLKLMRIFLFIALFCCIEMPKVLATNKTEILPPGMASIIGANQVKEYSADNPANQYTYTLESNGGTILGVVWSSSEATIIGSGENVTVRWTTNGTTGTLTADAQIDDGNSIDNYLVNFNVTVDNLPNYTPAKPTIGTRTCGNTEVNRVGTPPGTDTWEWVSPGSGNGATYNATVSGYYAIRAKNTAGYGPTSEAVYADVAQPSVAGTLDISGAGEGFGSAGATLTLSGHFGDQISWQNNASGSWSTFSTGGSSKNITATTTTSYRVQVKNDVCSSVYTNAVIVRVYTAPVISSSDGINGRKDLAVATSYDKYQWILDGQDIYGAVEETYTALEAGDYQVRVTPANSELAGTSAIETLDISPYNVMPANPNYVRSVTVMQEGIKTEGAIATSDTQVSTDYIDRQGRTIQTVIKEASPLQYDMVQHHEFNAYGQALKSYMTHTSTAKTGDFDPNAAVAQATFYGSGVDKATDTKPYSENKVEKSPAARMLESGGLGDGFQVDEYSAKYEYSFNTSADQIIDWQLDVNGDLDVANISYYANNKLSLQRVKSPEWTSGNEHTGLTFTNHLGQKILNRSFVEVDGELEYLDTYYVYDDFGRLTYVVPPEAIRQSQAPAAEYFDPNTLNIFTQSQDFPVSSSVNTTYYIANDKKVELTEGRVFEEGFDISVIPEHGVITGYDPVPDMDNYLFKNEYDDAGRLIIKKVPGADEVHYVYDQTGRLILSQDGKQRASDEWTFTKYDKLDRPVLTGVVTDIRERDALQTFIEGEIVLPGDRYEVRGSSIHGYTDNVWPRNVNADDYLVVSYYDDYDFMDSEWNNFAHDNNNGINNDPSLLMPRGQETGGKIRVLGSSTWLRSVKYYDDDLQLIQGISDHHRGTDLLEKVFTQYNWLGEVVKTRFTHQVDGTKTVTIDERFVYDNNGRLIEQYHSIDNEPEVLIAKMRYNEMGELIEKDLHELDDNTFVQSVDYRYNIRGQLTQINQASGIELAGETDDHPDRFGIDLYYGSSPTGLTFNTDNPTNLAGTTWSHSDMTADERAYGYAYDDANRLTGATYNEKSGGSWGTKANHFDVSDITYDRNGNIKTLKRKHENTLVDDLAYEYDGNRLWRIDDETNDETGFKDGAENGMEYDFDENGNMIKDDNKLITSIDYNMLNKPKTITFSNGDHIDYTYDASGTRLSMSVTTGSETFVTDYSSGLIYEDDELTLISMPQGRIVVEKVATDYNYDYQYHLTDHLGNIRATVAPIARNFLATMESDVSTTENSLFLNLDDSRHLDALFAKSGDESARLNANDDQIIGPAKALKVYDGDVVDLSVFARYVNTSSASQASTSLAIFDAIAAAYGVSGGGEVFDAFQGQFSGASLLAQSAGDVPGAYLNYILYDRNYENPQTGYVQVSSVAETNHEELTLSINVPIDGYLFTYVSNESSLDTDVYFDDFSVTHTSNAAVMQADDYYPFGLPIAGNKVEDNYAKENRFLYQGKEWQTQLALNLYDFHARQYDPATGRFTGVDPQAGAMAGWTPYHGMGNNPLLHTDPSGEILPIVAAAIAGAVINVGAQAIAGNINGLDDFFGYAALGAVSGAVGYGVGQVVAGGSAFAATATQTYGFGAGFAANGAAAGTAGFLSGSGNAWAGGASFSDGLRTGAITGLSAGVTAGVLGGIDAARNLEAVRNYTPKINYLNKGQMPTNDLGTMSATTTQASTWKDPTRIILDDVVVTAPRVTGNYYQDAINAFSGLPYQYGYPLVGTPYDACTSIDCSGTIEGGTGAENRSWSTKTGQPPTTGNWTGVHYNNKELSVLQKYGQPGDVLVWEGKHAVWHAGGNMTFEAYHTGTNVGFFNNLKKHIDKFGWPTKIYRQIR